ncbi:hypothetical protein ST47_g1666 [Ascochyta rabiei]|uniref:F-box domain-containing protein n=1 Tax=Didymella rabiei TaxID=5454 RepID=A0A163KRN6_DIDRA|nr:hypothetical protein ST47_g1666 [Ascochyta rabiei]
MQPALATTGASRHEDALKAPSCLDQGTSSRAARSGQPSHFLPTPRRTSPSVPDRQTGSCSPFATPDKAADVPEMASTGLAEAFARLSTSDSRQHALETLFTELTPHEWRFVKSLASKQTFQSDIIGQLPVELVTHVFSYLDTTTPWRLQLVSRSWAERLRSLVVLKNNLDSWYGGTVDLQRANLNFCRCKARSVRAFRNGPRSAQPDSSFTISAKLGLTQLLVHDNLIWLDENHHQVRLLNMRSWTSQTLNGVARERIRNVFASGEIVVFTTLTTAYVAELNSTGPLRRFRVSNSKLLSVVTCRERTVACAAYLQAGLLVYIWNFDTQQGRSISLSYDDSLFLGCQLNLAADQPEVGLLLQTASETIVLCLLDPAISQNAPRCPKILYYRLTYAGECLLASEHVLEGYDHDQLTHSDRRGLRFVPASHDGLFMLQGKSIHPLQFDESLSSFTIPYHHGLNATSLPIVWWKDTFIEAGTKDHIFVHREPRDCEDLLINDMYMLPEREGALEGVGSWEVIHTSSTGVSQGR